MTDQTGKGAPDREAAGGQTRRKLLVQVATLAAGAGCARRVATVRSLATAPIGDGAAVVDTQAAPELLRPGGAVIIEPRGQLRKFLVVSTGNGYFALDALCPHAGCELTWVPEDREAECPCHGSRFAGDGTVLHPPAVTDLHSFQATAPDAQGRIRVLLFQGDGVFREPVVGGQFGFPLSAYPALREVGGSVAGDPTGFPGGVIITRIAASGDAQFSAVSSFCSHLGCTLQVVACAGSACPPGGIPATLACPCHGSRFTVAGGFLSGPAGVDLTRYPVTLDGERLTVSATPLQP